MTTQHRQALTLFGIEVDEEVRPLVEALWSRGYFTQYSCQDCSADNCMLRSRGVSRAHRYVQMLFPNLEYAMDFVMKTTSSMHARGIPMDTLDLCMLICDPWISLGPRGSVRFNREQLGVVTEIWVPDNWDEQRRDHWFDRHPVETRRLGIAWDYEAAIERIVDEAPPLSDAQRDKLATLLAKD